MEYAAAIPVSRRELSPRAVLSEAWGLYKRLFRRSVLMGAIVFGLVELVNELAQSVGNPALIGFASILLTVAGVSLLQGGLVEIVRGLHVDGNDKVSVAEAFQRAGGRLWKLIRVSGRTGFGVALGTLLFVVPGMVLMTRWAVAVPVAMLEDGSPREAMSRSRAIVAGNGWNVFQVLFACSVLNIFASVPFLLVGGSAGPFGRWIALTLAYALTAPVIAHALIVVYYTLIEPGRPVALAPGAHWQSVWDAQDGTRPTIADDKTNAIEQEYARRFDQRSRQWSD